ncbi:MAG: 3-phosphoshikimate 1-carboxyvinyltransferase [Acidimicrobiia bacterium]
MSELTLASHGRPFEAAVTVPGDKSLSHRAVLFASMAEGDSYIEGMGTGADVASTINAMRALGVSIDGKEVRSPGIRLWRQPAEPIDCGNSGTTMRLVAGVLSTSTVAATLVGDTSLSRRPMARLVAPLESLGGVISTSMAGTAPLNVGGSASATNASWQLSVASAQLRTAFELAALAADGESTIDSPPGFRDHTERWLHAIGRGRWATPTAFVVEPGPIPAAKYQIPGDPSSAAFLWACAAISPGSRVTTSSISLNPGRLGFLEILDRMGAGIEAEVSGSMGGDPVGDVTVVGGDLQAVEVDGDLVASALDELPLVAVVAAYGEGLTTVRDAAELRAKESDRIASMAKMIRAMGGGFEERTDGFDVVGTGFLDGATVDPDHDHRIAMAAAVAATRASGDVVITDADVASVSWPGFYKQLENLWS